MVFMVKTCYSHNRANVTIFAHHEKRQFITAFSRILPLALERLILTLGSRIGSVGYVPPHQALSGAAVQHRHFRNYIIAFLRHCSLF